jgi:drug/metabolite transporter (DMT)-like permease
MDHCRNDTGAAHQTMPDEPHCSARFDKPSFNHTQSNPLKGIWLVIIAAAFFSMSDITIKTLSNALPAIQITWLRFLTFALMVAPAVCISGGLSSLRSRRPSLQVLRIVGMLGSAVLFTIGLQYLPVAEATAINFVWPAYVTALSVHFLGETVGRRRWISALVGLAGVLLIIRPGTGAFDVAAVFPLSAALCWAVAALITRKISGADKPITTLAYSALGGALVLSAIVPFHWVVPDWYALRLGILVGFFSTIGHALTVLAYRHADASILAPFAYSQVIWSGALGFMFFGAVPDGWTALGGGIVVASGLYMAWGERPRMI